jgi:HTH-type transcriptional regulator/antitoxin HigA
MTAADKAAAGWNPDWATHPGEHLDEHIEARGLSQAAFARLADLSPKLVSTIIAGKNPVTAETALKLERVLGLKAYVWTGLQAKYDLHVARLNEQRTFDANQWLARFPLKELRSRKVLPEGGDAGALVESLLVFMGIGSPGAYEAKLSALAVHHRQSLAYESSRDHVYTWLLLGERKARSVKLPVFDEKRFVQAVGEIRSLTTSPPEIFEPRMKQLCQSSGVALVFEPPLPKTCLFGSARWPDTDHAIIQMSLRMKSNDHFWWTFFHEAGHIALHRGKNFADDKAAVGDGFETEADDWANEILFGSDGLRALLAARPRSEQEVKSWAARFDLHPGIVVGCLQHHKVLPFTHLNGLKVRFELTA